MQINFASRLFAHLLPSLHNYYSVVISCIFSFSGQFFITSIELLFGLFPCFCLKNFERKSETNTKSVLIAVL